MTKSDEIDVTVILYILDCSVLPCLLEVLEKMQQLETESHLCIQSSVGGVTLQWNLILQGTSLVVQQETSKQKPATGSSLYLRVSVGIFYCPYQHSQIPLPNLVSMVTF